MNRRARVLLTIVILASVGGLAARITMMFERGEIEVRNPPGEAARRNPMLAAHRFLERQGVPSHALASLEAAPPPGHVLLVGARDLALSAPLTDALVQWVLEGGHLIAAPCDATGGERLLKALDVAVACLEEETIGTSVIFSDPDETLWVEVPWVDVSDLSEKDDADSARVVVHSLVRGKGRFTILGGTSVFMNDWIQNDDHARLLERLVTLGGAPKEAWIVYEVIHPDLAVLLWRHAWPAILAASAALGLFLWRASARFGPVLPARPAGSRSVMDHIEAVGLFLWQRRPEVLAAAARHETMRVVAERRPHLMKLGAMERAQALAALGGVREAAAHRALNAPEPTTQDEFSRAITALESIRRSL